MKTLTLLFVALLAIGCGTEADFDTRVEFTVSGEDEIATAGALLNNKLIGVSGQNGFPFSMKVEMNAGDTLDVWSTFGDIQNISFESSVDVDHVNILRDEKLQRFRAHWQIIN